MAHLFGVIGLRGGIGRPIPLLDDTNQWPRRIAVRRTPQPLLSCAAVVAALQAELHHRRASSLLAPETLRVADAMADAPPS